MKIIRMPQWDSWTRPGEGGAASSPKEPAATAVAAASAPPKTDETQFSEPLPEDVFPDLEEEEVPYHPAKTLEGLEEDRQRYQALYDESSLKVEQAKKQFEKFYPEPCPVPSLSGMDAQSASARLSRNNLGVKGITQEYSSTVPAGQVITQVPGAGSRISKGSGVRLIISKGPPPEREKNDTVRQKEHRYYRRKSRRQQEDDLKEMLPDPAAAALEPSIDSPGQVEPGAVLDVTID